MEENNEPEEIMQWFEEDADMTQEEWNEITSLGVSIDDKNDIIVPTYLMQHETIRTLNITAGYNIDLSTAFACFDSPLVKIVLDGVSNLILPQSISFQHLTKLLISDTPLHLNDSFFGSLPVLTELSMRMCSLTFIPSLSSMSSLQSLSLFGNKLESLHDSVATLTSLTELYCSSNQLHSLPSMFSQLTRLETLQLANNNFTQIPECIGQLKKLKKLNMIKNKITNLPKYMCSASLEVIKLSYNQISHVSSGIKNCTSLRKLYLSYNDILLLPHNIGQLLNLQTIMVDYNPNLATLPYTIANLPLLKDINFEAVEIPILAYRKWYSDPTLDLLFPSLPKDQNSLAGKFFHIPTLQELTISLLLNLNADSIISHYHHLPPGLTTLIDKRKQENICSICGQTIWGSGYCTERSVKTIHCWLSPHYWREKLANEPNTPIPPINLVDDEKCRTRNALVVSYTCSPTCTTISDSKTHVI